MVFFITVQSVIITYVILNDVFKNDFQKHLKKYHIDAEK